MTHHSRWSAADDQPSLSIFSRAALAKKAERVSPRAAAASSIAASRPASSEKICLSRPARIEDERYDCERGALCERRRHFGIGAQGLDRTRLRQFLTVGECVFSPQPHTLGRPAQDLIGGGSGGRAAGRSGTVTP